MEVVPQLVPRREERFTSWKEIAAYLKRDVRTVQRWETARGLPVHRLPGKARSPIYALKSELDEWWKRTPARLETPALPLAPAYRRLWSWLAAAVLTVTAAAVWIVWRHGQPPAPLPVVPLTSLPGAESFPTLSPDGTRLAFTWIPADSHNADIYVRNLPDGPLREISLDGNATLFDSNLRRHHPFVCERCGALEDVEWFEALKAARDAAAGRSVRTCEVVLRGTCENCLKENSHGR